MYENFGDRDFFEHGILVDREHSDTVFPMLLCRPYDDAEDLYLFGECEVDITDSWIDRKRVMEFVGMTEETYDPASFAVACTEYYSWENFGAMNYAYDWMRMDRAAIREILKHRLTALDNLDLVW